MTKMYFRVNYGMSLPRFYSLFLLCVRFLLLTLSDSRGAGSATLTVLVFSPTGNSSCFVDA